MTLPLRFTFGAIDRESLRSYTMLRDLLPALEPVFLGHNWLVTDCYCNTPCPSGSMPGTGIRRCDCSIPWPMWR